MAAQTKVPDLKLQDIHLPDEPGLWPLAPGWWILLAVVAILFIWISRKLYMKAKCKKHHRRVLAELDSLQKNLKESPSNENIAAINVFLRKLAVNNYPRQDIASLTGADWLHFLEQFIKGVEFSKGAGRILVDAPYQKDDVSNLNLEEFIPLIRKTTKNLLKQKQFNKSKLSKTGGGVL